MAHVMVSLRESQGIWDDEQIDSDREVFES